MNCGLGTDRSQGGAAGGRKIVAAVADPGPASPRPAATHALLLERIGCRAGSPNPAVLPRVAGYGDPALQGRGQTAWIRPRRGFSLVEVVVAIGLIAVSLVAILGLLAATTHSAAELSDAQGSASLGGSIQCELDRLRNSAGLAKLEQIVPPSGSAAPLRLVGTRDGLRVCCLDAADPAANRSLRDPVLSGIANRDRYYLIEATRLPEWETVADSGFVVVNARCTWPYELPLGPATPGATEVDADPAREVPVEERHVLVLMFAVTP
jgi:prepilin-type N-terminal cleavage/methylation domain-containing protein